MFFLNTVSSLDCNFIKISQVLLITFTKKTDKTGFRMKRAEVICVIRELNLICSNPDNIFL